MAGVLYQEPEQIELFAGERNIAPFIADYVRFKIYEESSVIVRSGAKARNPALNQCSHPGLQLTHTERFRDIIVSPEIKSVDLVVFARSCREDQDRNSRCL